MEKRKRLPLPLDASPQEKYDNLILAFYEEWQEYIGNKILFYDMTSYRFEGKSVFSLAGEDCSRLGFASLREFLLYVDMIIERKHLSTLGTELSVTIEGENRQVPQHVKLSFSALNYCHSLLESGKNSQNCFVAMKYGDEKEPYMTRYYDEGIVKAVKDDNGFNPIRIDREHADNEQTINDFIIARIKQSRFCVADLTHQSHGAYFEAGYALGRGLKVIYTCHEKDWANLHFDVKSFQVLKYASVEELREKLKWKIQAFVMD